MFIIYKREEVERIHEPSWYAKEQLPYMTSNELVFFDKFHMQQFSGPPMKSKFTEQNIRFKIYEEGNIDVKTGHFQV